MRTSNKANGGRLYADFWRDMANLQHTKAAPPPPVGDVVRVVDPASKPVGAEGPNRFLFLALGLGVGLLLGLFAAFGMRQPHGVRRLVGFGVTGFVLAAAASFLIPNRYTSERRHADYAGADYGGSDGAAAGGNSSCRVPAGNRTRGLEFSEIVEDHSGPKAQFVSERARHEAYGRGSTEHAGRRSPHCPSAARHP